MFCSKRFHAAWGGECENITHRHVGLVLCVAVQKATVGDSSCCRVSLLTWLRTVGSRKYCRTGRQVESVSIWRMNRDIQAISLAPRYNAKACSIVPATTALFRNHARLSESLGPSSGSGIFFQVQTAWLLHAWPARGQGRGSQLTASSFAAGKLATGPCRSRLPGIEVRQLGILAS